MSRENLGLLHLYTGGGAGKTTAAVGLGVRAAGRGLQVVMAQFLKSQDTGELAGLEALGVRVLRVKRRFPFVFQMSSEEKALQTQLDNELLTEALGLCREGGCDLLILDEIAAAYTLEQVDRRQVDSLLADRPRGVELVLTGRDMPPAWLELADYVTEMRKVKHPYSRGVAARKGIEW